MKAHCPDDGGDQETFSHHCDAVNANKAIGPLHVTKHSLHEELKCGVNPDPSKSDVAKWPTPTNKKEVQQFLGLANYYRHFIKNFASIAKPLQRLTEKNLNFEWTDTCHDAFNKLRKCLVTAPIPDFLKKFILDIDRGDCGIRAVLSQVQDDGSESVILYACRSLSRQEQCYSVTCHELLAVINIIHHFISSGNLSPFEMTTSP